MANDDTLNPTIPPGPPVGPEGRAERSLGELVEHLAVLVVRRHRRRLRSRSPGEPPAGRIEGGDGG
jgi:hypothetical protein